MKKIVMIIVILSAVVLAGTAQNYTTSQVNDPAIQSQQIMQSGSSYQGTVYEPFGNTTPSDYNPVAGEQGNGSKPKGPVRKGFDIGGDTGQGPSPVGDAVLPLLLCALAFGFVIARRRKRAE